MTPTMRDIPISPSLHLLIDGPVVLIGPDADLRDPARLTLADLRRLRAVLDEWEDGLLAKEVGR